MRLVRLLFLLLLPLGLFAQGENALQKLREKFEEINGFSADFEQNSGSVFGSASLNIKGSLLYKKGNRFNIRFGNNNIISNGETIWNYDSRRDRVVINTFDEQNSIFTLDYFLTDLANRSEVTLGDGGGSVLLTPDNDNYFASLKIYYDRSYIINKIEITDLSETSYIIILKNVKILNDIDDSEFEYEIKEGINVIDFR